jgi:peptidoglycan/LPS O-acetylase OafA/YrhL
VPVAGKWPLLERIPRRRFLRMRRNGRVTSLVGAFVIAVLVAAFVEYDFPVPHLITIASSCAWVLVITCMTKQRWLRWLRDEFAGEVSAKLDGIRRAAPFN